MTDTARVRPFSCGTQHYDWLIANCDKCAKQPMTEEACCFTMGVCPIFDAISEASVDDGTISAEIAERMGWTKGPPFDYCWRCNEWQELPASAPGMGEAKCPSE